MRILAVVAAWLAVAIALPLFAGDATPIDCDHCARWNEPIAPFRIHRDVYYIGTRELASVLIDTGSGLVVLDAGLPQTADRIVSNIRALGFKPRDVRWIVNSHEHFDHAGGIAALARTTGARVAASPRGAQALRAGAPSSDDPQAGFGDSTRFPPVRAVRSMADGESIELGRLALRANHTPGHTPGATTWTWRSCAMSGVDCLDFVYADSLNPVSAPGFRFIDDAARALSFDASVATFRSLPCDALVPVHPEFDGPAGHAADFVGKDKCVAYAARVASRWELRQREERSGARDGTE